MLPLVLSLGKLVPEKEYGKLVLDPVVKLYTSPDRGTRMALLDGLSEYSDKMDQRTVQERVWPHLVCFSVVSMRDTWADDRSLVLPIRSQSYEKQQSKRSSH
jgi:SCY1-like protein 1